jgi:hypothetical protein
LGFRSFFVPPLIILMQRNCQVPSEAVRREQMKTLLSDPALPGKHLLYGCMLAIPDHVLQRNEYG